jgi:hypothetical protein
MNRRSFCALAAATALAAGLGLVGQASGQSGWVQLFDGKSIDTWDKVGDANWRIVDGAIEADKGNGFLVTRNSYKDFQLRAEFWADHKVNSGIFIRCTDPKKIGAENAYEVNVYDERPDPSYGTGAIVNFAKVSPMPKAGGKWNVFEITAQGDTLTVILNGQKTVDGLKDSKFSAGPIALQYGTNSTGAVKFRKVEIRTM